MSNFDPKDMVIDGLTGEQRAILDAMWSIQTTEQLLRWIRSLPTPKRTIATALYSLVALEALDQMIDDQHVFDEQLLTVKAMRDWCGKI